MFKSPLIGLLVFIVTPASAEINLKQHLTCLTQLSHHSNKARAISSGEEKSDLVFVGNKGSEKGAWFYIGGNVYFKKMEIKWDQAGKVVWPSEILLNTHNDDNKVVRLSSFAGVYAKEEVTRKYVEFSQVQQSKEIVAQVMAVTHDAIQKFKWPKANQEPRNPADLNPKVIVSGDKGYGLLEAESDKLNVCYNSVRNLSVLYKNKLQELLANSPILSDRELVIGNRIGN